MINEMDDQGDNGGGDGGNNIRGGEGSGTMYDNLYSSCLQPPSFNMFASGNGIRKLEPPPFLAKLFNIVNDPNTNFIISWGSFGNSIIIWDHLKFSADLLPIYFKHSNFASFMYQLNNYGFRKIGVVHQWEYENPDFQAGKEHLLTKIKRKNTLLPETTTQQRRRKRADSPDKNTIDEMELKLENLRNKIMESKLEIDNLKRQQAAMELQIQSAEADLKKNAIRDRLIRFSTKMCDEFFAQKNRGEEIGNEIDDDEISKKRKLDEIEESDGEIDRSGQEIVRGDANLIPLLENRSVSVAIDESAISVNLDCKIEGNCEERSVKKEMGDYSYWEQIMLDDEVCGDEIGSDGTRKQQEEIAAELEDLIANLPN